MSGNDTPLVSVVVPYYNGRRFIREALESIRCQTWPCVEIVVVDDASPRREDSQYLETLVEEFGFRLLRHEANRGIGPTLADGAEASRGEFIAELSQDDLYKPFKLERQVRMLMEDGLDAVYAVGDIACFGREGIEIRDTRQTAELIRSGRAAEYLMRQNLSAVSIQGLMAKRLVFEQEIVPIWRDFLMDDWPVNIRLFERCRVGFIEEPLWTGRAHDENTSRNVWKWFGPQVEVVARMTPEPLRAEVLGGRMASMARRLLKQNGPCEEIIRLSLASLMLADSTEQRKKAFRVLDKLPLKDRKRIIGLKYQSLRAALASPRKSEPSKDGRPRMDWDRFGKAIARIVADSPEMSRLRGVGGEYFRLADTLRREGVSNGDTTALRLALAAWVLTDSPEEEAAVLEAFHPLMTAPARPWLESKAKILKAKSSWMAWFHFA